MSTHLPSADQKPESGAAGKIGLKAIVRFALYVLLQPLALFLAAGRTRWPMGWAYVVLSLVATLGSRFLVMRKHPDLIAERATALDRKDAQAGDKLLVNIVGMLGPLAVLVVAGLDQRFAWSPHVPLALQWLALATVVCGFALGTWAMLENRFFSAVVRIQTDRRHTVITSGPYRFVRHPSYLGGIAAGLAMPVMLSSLWALIPAALIALAVIIRTAMEDRMLQDGLDGYAEYARRVRYRLLPGVW